MSKAKFLAHHVRDVKGNPFATLVALSATAIGLAVCNKRDTMNKKLGLSLAAGRAALGTPFPTIRADNKRNIAILEAAQEFHTRADKYFNKQKRENAKALAANVAKALSKKRRKTAKK